MKGTELTKPTSTEQRKHDMNITIKNVKICGWNSQETTCFQATIYIDGKKAGDASNEGMGGCNNYYFKDRELEQRFYDYCKALPPVDYNGHELSMDADLLLGDLIADYERNKTYKRWCKKETIFKLVGEPEDSFRVVKALYCDKVVAYIKKQYGDKLDYILNERLQVQQIRAICAKEFGVDDDYSFFSSCYREGEAPDNAILRLFNAEREHNISDKATVLVMCHG